MTDLVDRLRAHQFMGPSPTKLELEAADEIEKLRAALRAARPFVDQYHGQGADPVMALIDAALR